MSSFVIVEVHPFIQILLELVQVFIKSFTEGNSIELILHGPMKPLADAICLWMADLGLAMLDTFDLQIHLVFVILKLAFVLCTAISQYAQ